MTHSTIASDLREQLCNLQQESHALEDAVRRINSKFEKLTDCLEQAGYSHQNSEISEEEVAKLLQLNRYLSHLQNFLLTLSHSLSSELDNKVSDPGDKMDDYECEVELNYTLRSSDPDWNDESDNFVTKRRLISLKRAREELDDEDWRVFVPGLQHINAEPHCWLFHDLYDHSYGLDQPSVSLRDCLRLGEVWVDVVIRQQYWFNLDTGTWEKTICPNSKLNAADDQ